MYQTIVTKALILSIFFITVVSLYAQDEGISTKPQYHFSSINSERSLKGVVIQDIVKDLDGFMWFATYEGLIRYDGQEFKLYEHDPYDDTSLSNDIVISLLTDPKGYLWVTTRDGLNKFDPVQETFQRFFFDNNPNLFERSNDILEIVMDQNQNLWMVTFNSGLVFFDTTAEVFTVYKHDPDDPTSIRTNRIFGLDFDGQGKLWLGGSHGGSLQRFDPVTEEFTQIHPDDSSEDFPDLIEIYVTRNGEIWCGSWGEGVYVYHPNDGSITNFKHDEHHPNSPGSDFIHGIYEDNAGKIWITVRNKGIDVYDPSSGEFTHLEHDPDDKTSVTGNTVITVYGDEDGLIWFGTLHDGVFYYDPNFANFTLIQAGDNPNSLNHNYIYSLIIDSKDRLWIGTNGGGVNIFDLEQQSFSYMLPDPNSEHSISVSTVTSLYEDSKGRIWFGNWNTTNSLDVYDPVLETYDHYELLQEREFVNGTDVRVILEDRNGRMWFGTQNNGLCRIDEETKTIQSYKPNGQPSEELQHLEIISMHLDRYNNIWMGTFSNGVSRINLDTNQFETFQTNRLDKNSISANKVNCIFEDSDERIWFGTTNGICCWSEQKQHFIRFFDEQGLDKIEVRSIIEDQNHDLWFSTKKSQLFRLTLSPFQYYRFAEKNGVQPLEFTANSACMISNGLLCFGGLGGLNIVDPNKIKQKNDRPPVVITSIETHKDRVPIQSFTEFLTPFQFYYDHDYLRFNFAALEYSQSEKNQFAYSLSPVDDGWWYIGDEQEVSFTALEAGEYTFIVKAANHQGLWNEEGVSVPFVIYPPWWETWWFRMVFLFLFGLVIVLYYTKRTYAIRANNRKLAQEVERQTKSVSQLNTSLVMRNEELKDALAHIKTLKGIIPICASCKKIRDDKGYWQQVESYVAKHSDAEFSHGYCPECYEKEMSKLLNTFPPKNA